MISKEHHDTTGQSAKNEGYLICNVSECFHVQLPLTLVFCKTMSLSYTFTLNVMKRKLEM